MRESRIIPALPESALLSAAEVLIICAARFLVLEMGDKSILVTGRPGVGKTTLVRNVARQTTGAGGFYTEEVREDGVRAGFDIVTLDGQREVLSSVHRRLGPRVGQYIVSIEGVDGMAVPAVEKAIADGRLVVIDEIGKMELYSDKFKEVTIRALNSDVPVLATIMSRPEAFCDAIKLRDDVELVVVTLENRNELADRLLSTLRTLLSNR
ncbi:MAG TPA: NTPase [Methanomassiliicoccales archaeon]|nr:NTPase [Methanomassiliicoccales archaeon]